MPSKPPILFPTQTKMLKAFGLRLKTARLVRRFSIEIVAERANVSRQTITKVEQGHPTVTMGTYLRVMAVLGFDKDIELLIANDRAAIKLLEDGVVTRKRAPKRIKQ